MIPKVVAYEPELIVNTHATTPPAPTPLAATAAATGSLARPVGACTEYSRLHAHARVERPAEADDACAANAAEFDAQQEVAVDAGLLFYYRGGFTLPAVQTLGRQLKQRLQEAEVPALARQKLFSVFLVLAHNVHHHGASDIALPLGVVALGTLQASPQGTIAIGRHHGTDSYWVMCHNQIDEVQVPLVSERLERVRSMDARQIEAAFRAQMLHEGAAVPRPARAGAGQGLMTVARHAREPLQFSLRRAGPKPCDRFHLYLTAVI